MQLTPGLRVCALLTAALPLMLACAREPAPPPDGRKATELSGTPADRVGMVRDLLTAPPALRETLVDAQFREERAGDGKLGPADLFSFYALTVSPGDIPSWLQALPPLDTPPPTAPPTTSSRTDWWVQPEDFTKLRFFGSGTVTPRTTGWVGVDSAKARIYIYTFTQ
jgi:hypothetical protein